MKNNKEYTVRLTHPEFGEYYFSHINRHGYSAASSFKFSYVFTKDLSKVTTWKTIKYVENEIKDITEKLIYHKADILFSFGSEVKDEIKNKLIFSRKKYYYRIEKIASLQSIENSKNIIDELKVSLVTDSENITQLIKDNKLIEKDFNKKITKFKEDISRYKFNYEFIEKLNDDITTIDIADASYGFRALKLRKLNNYQEKNEEIIEE